MTSEAVITLGELRQHNGKNGSDYWMAIHDVVYNVTKFMDKHPGGEAVLIELAGDYATQGFEDVQHSDDAVELLKTLKVGVLAQEDHETKQTETQTDAQESGSFTKLLPILLPLGLALMYAIYSKYL